MSINLLLPQTEDDSNNIYVMQATIKLLRNIKYNAINLHFSIILIDKNSF
jgi:hypothetical protein